MKVNMNKLPKSKMELTIELTVEELDPFLKKAKQRISQKKNVSGFRPGKTPDHIVEQQFGAMAVYEEAMEDILNDSYLKTIKENQILPVEKPKIDILKFAPGNPFSYKATFAILPKAKISDYEKIKIKRKKIEIKSEQVENALEEIQRMRAKETLVDREIKNGDKILADMEMSIDKVILEGGTSKNTQIIIGDPFFVPGLGEKLIGSKKNETKEFSLKFPKNHYDKKIAGKLVDFKVKINEIYQIDYPELTDEFVKSLGNFKNVEKLKEKLKENLEEEEKNKEEQKFELEILDTLLEKSEFEEIPDALIDMESEKMIAETEAGISQKGMKFEDYLSHIKKTKEDFKKDLTPKAEKRVKTILLINDIIQQEKIKITDEEIEKAKQETLSLYPNNPEISKNIQSEGYKNYLINFLKNRKAIDFLKSKILV